jgi:ubiquinone/menaquinone biosynthesis C-methylase UbiE
MLTAGVASAQQTEADRERTERVADILVALGAKDGARIADVGSGEGFYALRIARAVAPAGRTYAVDINEPHSPNFANARHVTASPTSRRFWATDDPKLPSGEIDAVLIRNAYHEMTEYRGVLASVMRALRPGGTLIVSEPIHDNNRDKTRELQVKEHEIAPEFVEAELREAGFEILERQEAFMSFTRPPPGGFWMIRARRPAAKQ